ncbi:MAG: hypothetical protein HY390_02070 [Deltaproteobacteria bacterium]|nr:hypothetical protein [Deltaproteobacteria bacterium]
MKRLITVIALGTMIFVLMGCGKAKKVVFEKERIEGQLSLLREGMSAEERDTFSTAFHEAERVKLLSHFNSQDLETKIERINGLNFVTIDEGLDLQKFETLKSNVDHLMKLSTSSQDMLSQHLEQKNILKIRILQDIRFDGYRAEIEMSGREGIILTKDLKYDPKLGLSSFAFEIESVKYAVDLSEPKKHEVHALKEEVVDGKTTFLRKKRVELEGKVTVQKNSDLFQYGYFSIYKWEDLTEEDLKKLEGEKVQEEATQEPAADVEANAAPSTEDQGEAVTGEVSAEPTGETLPAAAAIEAPVEENGVKAEEPAVSEEPPVKAEEPAVNEELPVKEEEQSSDESSTSGMNFTSGGGSMSSDRYQMEVTIGGSPRGDVK